MNEKIISSSKVFEIFRIVFTRMMTFCYVYIEFLLFLIDETTSILKEKKKSR